MIRPGLKKHIKSNKDYSFARTFGAIRGADLPTEYFYDNGNVPDQGSTTLCTGYTATDICMDEDGVQYSPDYNFAKTLQLKGSSATAQGASLKDAFSVAVGIGLLPQNQAPINWQEKGQTFIADYKNWPESLDTIAGQNKKSAYLFVDGPFDAFDNVRSTIWLNRDLKMAVGVGTSWYNEYENVGSDGILPKGKITYGGHAWKVCGWKVINNETYLICKTWQGPWYGDKGYVYMNRAEFNRLMSQNGAVAMTISKVTPSDVKTIKMSLTQRITALVQLLISKLQESLFSPQQ